MRLLLRRSSLGKRREKLALINAQRHRKIRIAFGQSPQRMQMIRQDHHRVDMKWMRLFHVPHHLAQAINVIHQ